MYGQQLLSIHPALLRGGGGGGGLELATLNPRETYIIRFYVLQQ